MATPNESVRYVANETEIRNASNWYDIAIKNARLPSYDLSIRCCIADIDLVRFYINDMTRLMSAFGRHIMAKVISSCLHGRLEDACEEVSDILITLSYNFRILVTEKCLTRNPVDKETLSGVVIYDAYSRCLMASLALIMMQIGEAFGTVKTLNIIAPDVSCYTMNPSDDSAFGHIRGLMIQFLRGGNAILRGCMMMAKLDWVANRLSDYSENARDYSRHLNRSKQGVSLLPHKRQEHLMMPYRNYGRTNAVYGCVFVTYLQVLNHLINDIHNFTKRLTYFMHANLISTGYTMMIVLAKRFLSIMDERFMYAVSDYYNDFKYPDVSHPDRNPTVVYVHDNASPRSIHARPTESHHLLESIQKNLHLFISRLSVLTDTPIRGFDPEFNVPNHEMQEPHQHVIWALKWMQSLSGCIINILTGRQHNDGHIVQLIADCLSYVEDSSKTMVRHTSNSLVVDLTDETVYLGDNILDQILFHSTQV